MCMIFIFVFFISCNALSLHLTKEKCIAVHLLANILQKNEFL